LGRYCGFFKQEQFRAIFFVDLLYIGFPSVFRPAALMPDTEALY
jgi:hypothetical protein